ncbi:MAG: bifunctional oligoribonuclease/PAP phosphatase NrnA [Spirochaetales bacterium]|nr:bifunctional oligoribonuclease/PAP phosphatase NrnA [Spirochaetales bacterium]
MNISNALLAKQIFEQIKASDKIVVCSHVKPDGDAFGSSFGLAYILRDNFPQKNILVSSVEHAHIRFFPSGDFITDEFMSQSLVIIVDTASGIRVYDQRWSQGKFIIKIDHHPLFESFGDIELVNDSYPSCCEIIIDLIREWELKISQKSAEYLFAGLTTDTGRFRFPGVGKATFERASFLCSLGVHPSDVYDSIYQEKASVLRFRGWVSSNFVNNNGFAYVKVKKDITFHYGISPEQANSMVNLLSDLEDVKIWTFFCEDPVSGQIKVEFRSCSIAVNEIARKFGGWGHRLASGTVVENWKVVDSIIEYINEMLKSS